MWRLTLKPQVASGVAVAPEPQFLQLDWISVFEGAVVSLSNPDPFYVRQLYEVCVKHSLTWLLFDSRARAAPVKSSVSCSACEIAFVKALNKERGLNKVHVLNSFIDY